MAEYTQFTATSPTVVPATQEVVYDKYWLVALRIQAQDPTKPARAMAVFAPARDVTVDNGEGGTITYKELNPKGERKQLVIKDLFGEAETNLALSEALEGVLAVLNEIASEEGIL